MAVRHREQMERELEYERADVRPAPDEAPLEPYRAHTWRDDVADAAKLNVIAGIWLIISPFVLGYGSGDAIWNPIVFGAIVTVLALARAAGAFRASYLSVVNMAIGVWLFVSAFWLASSSTASWNVGILGVVVFVLAAWSAGATHEGTAPTARR